ncbi:MAG: DNA gyrase inhibitor YacG [Candidatus Acidiferrales bacterium]
MRHRCPICHTPTDSEKHADFPFCSERCRLTDLGNWATGKYRIAAPLFDESEAESLPTDDPEKDSDDHVQ